MNWYKRAQAVSPAKPKEREGPYSASQSFAGTIFRQTLRMIAELGLADILSQFADEKGYKSLIDYVLCSLYPEYEESCKQFYGGQGGRLLSLYPPINNIGQMDDIMAKSLLVLYYQKEKIKQQKEPAVAAIRNAWHKTAQFFRMVQEPTLRQTLSLDEPFTESVFPNSEALISQLGLLKQLERIARKLKYESPMDYVFCALNPEYESQCRRFYEGEARPVAKIIPKRHLAVMDDDISHWLSQTAKNKTTFDETVRRRGEESEAYVKSLIEREETEQQTTQSNEKNMNIRKTAQQMMQPQQTQPAQQSQPLNQRQAYMIQLLNKVTGVSIPVTPEGYNQVGRSNGIMAELSKPAYVGRVLASEDFQAAIRNNPDFQRQAIGMFLQSVSRGQP